MQQAYIIIGNVFNFKNKNAGIDRARSKFGPTNSSNARLNTTIYCRIVKLNELTICAEQFYGSLKVFMKKNREKITCAVGLNEVNVTVLLLGHFVIKA
jgi:hypothetical protein